MKYFLTTIAALLIWSGMAKSQNPISVEDAISIALKNNFDILVSRNDADVDKVNNTPGAAGMLPTLQVSGSGSYDINNIHQELASGTVNNTNGLKAKGFSASSRLVWTLYDGGKMFVTRNKLTEIEAQGEIQYQGQVLATVYDVIAAYYNIIRQKQIMNSINEVINYNKKRLAIAEAGFKAGSFDRTDLLQAQIDMNVATENAINQQYTIDVAKRSLNQLLGKSPSELTEVSDSIPLDYAPNEALLKEKIFSENMTVKAFQKQVEIARLSLREFESGFLPKVSVDAGYYFSQTDNSKGNTALSRTSGPQFGASLTIPVFSAGENKRKTAAAQIQVESAEYDLQQLKLQLSTELSNALTSFANQQKLREIEKENKELTKINIDICLERLRLGQSTTLELHQAQENYAQSCTRLINFEYNLKIAEIKLKQLAATLQ